MAEQPPRTPASGPAAPPVAPIRPGGPAAAPAPGPGAKDTAPKFGGLRGGKRREDGLVPGSPEAKEADRKKEAQRKRDERAAKQQPPPLPSAASAMEGSSSPAGGGLGTLPGAPVPPVVPWEASTAQPIVDLFLPTAEQAMVNQLTSRAIKAGLPEVIVKEIEKDAHWSPIAKKSLEQHTAAVTAKWLNTLGVDSQWQPEIAMLTALGRIASGHVLLLKRLDEIAKANAQTAKPTKEGQDK